MVNFNVKYKYVEGEFDIQYIDIWLMLQLNMERLKFAGKHFFWYFWTQVFAYMPNLCQFLSNQNISSKIMFYYSTIDAGTIEKGEWDMVNMKANKRNCL